MKFQAVIKTCTYYIVALLFDIILLYLVHLLHNKMYKTSGLHYIFIITLSMIKSISIYLVLVLIIYLFFSTPNIYRKFLNKQYAVNIGKKPKARASINDLRFLFNYHYSESNLDVDKWKIIYSLITFIIATIFIFFFCAFSVEMFFFYHRLPETYIYVAILSLWTTLFTLFYLYNNIFFRTPNRIIYTYTMLIILYIIALFAKNGIFSDLLVIYNPYNDDWLNSDIQIFLYNYIIRFSEYIIDWALIQSVLLAILNHFKVGLKSINKFLSEMEKDRKEYESLLEVLNIIEEIHTDIYLKDFCLNLTRYLKNGNYSSKLKRQILQYHQKIMSIYPFIADSEFIWILDKFSIKFLVNQKIVRKITNTSPQEKLIICNSCKSLFFSTEKVALCINCQRRAELFIK